MLEEMKGASRTSANSGGANGENIERKVDSTKTVGMSSKGVERKVDSTKTASGVERKVNSKNPSREDISRQALGELEEHFSKRFRLRCIALIVLGVVTLLFALFTITIGDKVMSFTEILHFVYSFASDYLRAILSGKGFDLAAYESHLSQGAIIVLDIRLPRILAALSIGASLALSGAMYQGIMGNPLVSPSILGVLNGASFGAALAMILRFSEFGIEVLCFIFGLVAMMISVTLSMVYSRGTTSLSSGRNVLMLILGGIITSSLFGAALSIMKLNADPYNTLPSIVYWLMGSLANVSYPLTFTSLFFMVVCFVASLYLGKALDILNLGDEEAINLGVNVKRLRFIVIVLATLLASVSVALGGLIGWIGLVVPHIARFIVGSSHFFVFIFCALFGGLFLLISDTLARTLLSTEIPIGVLTSLIGVPIFAGILWVNRMRNE